MICSTTAFFFQAEGHLRLPALSHCFHIHKAWQDRHESFSHVYLQLRQSAGQNKAAVPSQEGTAAMGPLTQPVFQTA